MTEVARLAAVLAVPIVGEFHQGSVAARALALLHQRFVLWRGEENERVAVLLVDSAARLFEPELVAVEVERLIEVAHAQHGVQISHNVTSWHRLEPNGRSIHDRAGPGDRYRRTAGAGGGRARHRPVHRSVNFQRAWHSRFPLARRALDKE